MSDTLAHRRSANPAPALPEFFDTFHVLIRPVYASKYFPAQGVFLALGERLTGHPAVGVWLSSALACAAMIWMLEAWIGAGWALLGGMLMALQYGVYGYWSQTYWGGMVAALGGALTFGAARRLWDKFSWKNSVWLALGIVILINSRPLEGAVALLPIIGVLVVHFWRQGLWRQPGFWSKLVLPAGIALAAGAFLTCSYNRAITGSLWKPPYMLHEEQYQESPQFNFLPLHPKLSYSNPWLQYYYEVQEMRLYEKQRDPRYLIKGFRGRIASWWEFYCGVLLTPALVIPGLLITGRIRYLQLALLVALAVAWMASVPDSVVPQGIFAALVFAQLALWWFVFDSFWARIAIATSTLLILESFLVKWYFPHYFAPAACLILYLQVEGLRKIWEWNPQAKVAATAQSRQERRRLARETEATSGPPRLRGLVYLLPIACLLSLVLRVEGRINGWKQSIYDPDLHTLPIHDWSLRRADLEKYMEKQPSPQLVFVRYSPRHNVNYEWVYNHADIMHSHVIWARDLGSEHNRLLLQLLPDRTAWLLEADRREPQLVAYSEVDNQAPQPVVQKTDAAVEQDQLDW